MVFLIKKGNLFIIIILKVYPKGDPFIYPSI